MDICNIDVIKLRKLQRLQKIDIVIYKQILEIFYNGYFFCKDSFFKQTMQQIKSFKFDEYSMLTVYAKIILFPKKEISTMYILHLFHVLTAIGISFNQLKNVLHNVCKIYNFELFFSSNINTKDTTQLVLLAGHYKIYIKSAIEK